MDTSFVFPRPQAPIPRPSLAHNKLNSSGSGSSTATTAADTTSRESSALRASVLDAALELGLGSNSVVANWMFSNTLEEEPEEVEDPVSSPGLTYGSSATSDESSFSALTTPSSSTHSSSAASSSKFLQQQQPLHSMNTRPGGANGFLMGIEEEESKVITFPETLVPQRPTTPAAAATTTRKLKKKQKGDGGYESDGGYLSEGGKKKDKKEKGVAFPSVETEKEAKKRAKQEKKELLEEERQRKKSLTKASKKAAADSKDYDTDGGGMSFGLGKSKSKKKSSSSKAASEDMGYETDGGVKKSKTRFFKLSNKGSTRPDLSGVLKGSSNGGSAEVVPAVPAIPKEVVSLPIAERFATTLMSSLSQESSHLLSPTPTESEGFGDRSTAATPVPSGFQSFSPIPASNTPNTTYPNYNTPYPTPRSRGPIPFPTSADDRVSSASQGTTTTTSSGSGSSHGRSAAAALEYTYKPHGNTNGSGSGSQSTLHSPQVEQRPFSPPMPMSPPPSGSLKPPMSMPNSRSVSPAVTMTSSRSRSPMPSSPLPSLFPSSSMPPSPNTATQSNSNSSSSPITTTSPTTITTPTNTTSPPVVPLNVKKGGGMRLKPSLENIGRSLRSHLPGGSSSNSNAVSPISLVSPISPVSPYATGGGVQNPARALSPTQQKIYISPPNTAVPPLDAHAHAQEDEEESSRLTIVPPSPGPSYNQNQNYIVPSPTPSPRMSGLPRSPSPNPNARYSQANNGGQRLSGLPPSPNVLAYYDIPPPSPPPVGPLPSVPVPQAGGYSASASAPVSPRLSPMPTASSASSSSSSFQNNTNQDVNSFLTNPHQFPSAEVLRQRVIDRTPRAPVVPAEYVSIQRGKESPFPKRPVLGVKPVPRRYEGLSYGQEGVGVGGNVGAARYRDGNGEDEEWERRRRKEAGMMEKERREKKAGKSTRFREAPSWIPGRPAQEGGGGYASEDQEEEEDQEDSFGYGGIQEDQEDREDEEDGKDILDALDGFVDRSDESFEQRERERGGRALGRSRSFEALRSGGDDDGGSPVVVLENMEEDLPPARPRIKSPPPSDPASTLLSTATATPNHRSSAYTYASEYTYEGDDHTTIGNRSSRWSAGSVYSRASILDEDESGRTRERLLREVEALMAKQRGRGARQEGEVPPVPRLPDAYNMNVNVNGGGAGVERGWNRF